MMTFSTHLAMSLRRTRVQSRQSPNLTWHCTSTRLHARTEVRSVEGDGDAVVRVCSLEQPAATACDMCGQSVSIESREHTTERKCAHSSVSSHKTRNGARQSCINITLKHTRTYAACIHMLCELTARQVASHVSVVITSRYRRQLRDSRACIQRGWWWEVGGAGMGG